MCTIPLRRTSPTARVYAQKGSRPKSVRLCGRGSEDHRFLVFLPSVRISSSSLSTVQMPKCSLLLLTLLNETLLTSFLSPKRCTLKRGSIPCIWLSKQSYNGDPAGGIRQKTVCDIIWTCRLNKWLHTCVTQLRLFVSECMLSRRSTRSSMRSEVKENCNNSNITRNPLTFMENDSDHARRSYSLIYRTRYMD